MSGSSIPLGYLQQLSNELADGLRRLKGMQPGSIIRLGDTAAMTLSHVRVDQVAKWLNDYVAAAYGGTNSTANFAHIPWASAPNIEPVTGAQLFRLTIAKDASREEIFIAISDTVMMRAIKRP